MRFTLLLSSIFLSFTAQASIKCNATLFKSGIAIKSDLAVQKTDGDISILSTEIQERMFQVGYNSDKKIYVLSVEDSKTNQKSETTLMNVNAEQESSGIVLAGNSLRPNEEQPEKTLLVCTK